ncbi:MAG: carboxypeptidase-like regulatory domain-containing protein, partial [Muribaculaceae bacterium]|nr:carboxypeptidase-like regulatory domain-containing protein [Muribaculaceae bacterium]
MLCKILSTVITFSIGILYSASSPTQIKGWVRDSQNGEPIGYATVKLIGQDRAVATDTAGFYVFENIKPGTYRLEASFIEYKVEQQQVTVSDGESATVDFTLSQDAFLLDQVVVTGNKSEMRRRVSSSLVNVVPSKIFDLVSACSLADGLNFQREFGIKKLIISKDQKDTLSRAAEVW